MDADGAVVCSVVGSIVGAASVTAAKFSVDSLASSIVATVSCNVVSVYETQ